MQAERIITVMPPDPALLREQKRRAEKLRVAAYCRVSTDQDEQQNSYEAQISYFSDRIERNPDWIMAGIFADEGISGTNAKKRPEFLKLMELCKRGKVDMILAKSISRFARNTVDCLSYIRMLKEMNVTVIFEKEGINTSEMTSELMISFMSAFAQAESESLSMNVTWGNSHVSVLANEGINIQEVARRLGHSRIEMTWNTYSHLYPREEERAVEILNSIA